MSEADNYWTRARRRSFSRRRFVAGAGSLAAGSAAILAGCGDDDDKGNGTATSTSSGGASPSASASGAASASASAAAKPVPGGTLRLAKLAADPGVDPAVYHLNNGEIVNTVFTQTMCYRVSTNKFAMDGMVSFEQVDPLTIVWKVRPNMKFHNGDPVTAEDWAYSMTRVPIITKERRGHTGTPLFNYIDSVTATEPLVATMKLKRPNPSTTIHMARQYFAFINKKVTEAQPVSSGGATKDVQEGPVGAGSGQMMIQSRDATGSKLVKNPNYFKHEPANDGFNVDGPYIAGIDTRVLPDFAAQKASFLAGDLDILPGGVDPLDLDTFKKNKNVTLKEVPNPAWVIFGFDHKKLFDTRARQAIRLAIDYDAYIGSIVAQKAVYQAPVNQAVPAFQPWDQAKIKSNYVYDPAKAKALWEQAGKPVDKLRILTGNDGQAGVDVASFAASSIKKAIGVDVVVEQVDPQTWAQRANRVPDKDWEMLQSGHDGVGAVSGVPEDSSLIWFDPRGYGPLSFQFATDSDKPEVKAQAEKVLALMQQQETELDVNKRKQILSDLQQYIFENAILGALMPIRSNQVFAYNARLQDVTPEDWSAYYYAYRRQTTWIKA
ncbi:MAG: ABC transporter substrate-binding protein [Dehalococcoidia bacterium]|nr:ABC transporter substrate-binding protein [Dehalococcoidia bacterium]